MSTTNTINRTQHNQFVEEVQGMIFGGYSRRVYLVAPNGRRQVTESIDENADPAQWAKEQKARLLSVQCGNGRPLSDYPEIYESTYGAGSWSVDIED